MITSNMNKSPRGVQRWSIPTWDVHNLSQTWTFPLTWRLTEISDCLARTVIFTVCSQSLLFHVGHHPVEQGLKYYADTHADVQFSKHLLVERFHGGQVCKKNVKTGFRYKTVPSDRTPSNHVSLLRRVKSFDRGKYVQV